MEEIERKFLLDAPPSMVEGRPSTRIRQGYVAITNNTEVRIRARSDDRLLTAKGGRGMVRREVTVPLTAEQFDAMWPLTEGRRVTKRRWVVPHGDIEFEIDVFEDHLDGLVIVEIEFPTSEASTAFSPPDWCGPEVTHDERYRNAALAAEGMPDPPR